MFIQGDETPCGRHTGFLLHSRCGVVVGADAWRIRWKRSTTSKQVDTWCSGRPGSCFQSEAEVFFFFFFWQEEGGSTSTRQESSLSRQTDCSAKAHPLLLPIIRAGCSSTDGRRMGAVEDRKKRHYVRNKGLLCLTTPQ